MFKVGDILKLNPSKYPFNTKKNQYWRFKVLAILDNKHGLWGDPIMKLERLDLPSHRIQKWTSKYMMKATD